MPSKACTPAGNEAACPGGGHVWQPPATIAFARAGSAPTSFARSSPALQRLRRAWEPGAGTRALPASCAVPCRCRAQQTACHARVHGTNVPRACMRTSRHACHAQPRQRAVVLQRLTRLRRAVSDGRATRARAPTRTLTRTFFDFALRRHISKELVAFMRKDDFFGCITRDLGMQNRQAPRCVKPACVCRQGVLVQVCWVGRSVGGGGVLLPQPVLVTRGRGWRCSAPC